MWHHLQHENKRFLQKGKSKIGHAPSICTFGATQDDWKKKLLFLENLTCYKNFLKKSFNRPEVYAELDEGGQPLDTTLRYAAKAATQDHSGCRWGGVTPQNAIHI